MIKCFCCPKTHPCQADSAVGWASLWRGTLQALMSKPQQPFHRLIQPMAHWACSWVGLGCSSILIISRPWGKKGLAMNEQKHCPPSTGLLSFGGCQRSLGGHHGIHGRRVGDHCLSHFCEQLRPFCLEGCVQCNFICLFNRDKLCCVELVLHYWTEALTFK